MTTTEKGPSSLCGCGTGHPVRLDVPQWPDECVQRLKAEIAALRDVLNFADGRSVGTGYALADLYAEDAPAQGVLARAGCHERRVSKAS